MNRPMHTQRIHLAFAIAAGAGLMAACGSNVQLGSQDQSGGGAGTTGGATGAGGIAPTGGTVGAGGAIASGGTTGVGSGGGGGVGSTGGSPNTGGTTPAGGSTSVPVNACTQAGGSCVAVYPGSCASGTVNSSLSCGTGVGVECCMPGGAGGSNGTGGATRAGGTTALGGATGTGGAGGSTGKTCGGRMPSPCAANEICDATPGFCDVADMTGTCVVKPQVCGAVYHPVCGCNGTTYSNDCERQVAGVSKNFDGACPTADAGQDASPSLDASSSAALCTATGGQVVSTLCCTSVTDFPSSCLVGACGCAPSNSHTVSTCTCATGCFAPGYGCVTCTVGADQTCNENLSDNSLHGQCVNGRCSCNTGSVLLASGKCQ